MTAITNFSGLNFSHEIFVKNINLIFEKENKNLVNLENSKKNIFLNFNEKENLIKITISLSLILENNNLDDKIEKEIKLNFETEKNLDFFLNLHDSLVLFKKNLFFVYEKIQEKIKKGYYEIRIQHSAMEVKTFNLQEKNISAYLDLFFKLDDELISLSIPIQNKNPEILKIENKKDIFNIQIDKNTRVRKATPEDNGIIISFIKQLAEFEKLLHEVVVTEEILNKSLFGETAYAEVLIYEINENPVAFAIYFHNFSSFLGTPGLYLEDIYVKPEYRKLGIGSFFFECLSKIAIERNCQRMEWFVLNWNIKAIDFYSKMGAYPMSEWSVYRMDRKDIEKLAEKKY